MTFEEAKQKKKEDKKKQKDLKKKNAKLLRKTWKLRHTLCNKINCGDCPFEGMSCCVAFGDSPNFPLVEGWMKATLTFL